jgi:hypothetical protein
MSAGNWLRQTRAWLRIRRKILKRRTEGLDLPIPTVRISRNPSIYRHDCEFGRDGMRYWLGVPRDNIAYVLRYHRMAGFLYWLTLCPAEVSSFVVNLSDGQRSSRARFAMSVNRADVVALPDSYFFASRGFREMRAIAESQHVEWSGRSNILRWRGWINGEGETGYSGPDAAWDETVLPRIRMALILHGTAGTDVGFTGSDEPLVRECLRRDGLLRDHIAETEWINDKFALDIDGHTNTWSNFLVRMHLGCCVLKIASQHGYRQWYYDRIRPWEHFVPVRADMSDLVEKIDWARSHDAEAKAIAANGQAFARSMTFESETEWAVNAICAANGVSPV